MVRSADKSSQPIFSKYASPSDWPWTISIVIGEARRLLSYLDNVPEEAMPPESLWHSPQKCMAWIKQHLASIGKNQGQGMLEFSDKEVERA